MLVTVGFILLKPALDPSGYPPLFAFLLVMLFINIPVLLGILLFEGKRLNGKLSLEGVVIFREKLGWKAFTIIFVGAFVALFLLITVAMPVSNYLTESVFSGLPSWMFMEEQTQYGNYGKNVLLVTFTLQLVITGVILPWVEELYFRGYLLPRLGRFGAFAPLVGGLLFGLYHSWQPFGFLTVFLLGTGLGYVIWWKRDIRLGIGLHVFANALMRVFLLLSIIAS